MNFIESLYIGMKTLMKSSEYFEDEETGNKDKQEVKKRVWPTRRNRRNPVKIVLI